MNAFTLALLLVRYAAFSAMLHGCLIFLPSVVLLFVPSKRTEAIGVTLSGLTIIIFSAALWFFSPRLAKRMCRGADDGVTNISLNVRDCYMLLLVGLGLTYLVSGLGPALGWLQYLLASAGTAREQSLNYYEAFSALLPILLAIALLIWAGKLTAKLTARHLQEVPPIT